LDSKFSYKKQSGSEIDGARGQTELEQSRGRSQSIAATCHVRAKKGDRATCRFRLEWGTEEIREEVTSSSLQAVTSSEAISTELTNSK